MFLGLHARIGNVIDLHAHAHLFCCAFHQVRQIQFTEQFCIMDLAHLVEGAAKKMGVSVEIDHIPDPRVEAENHYYNAKHSKLIDLGLQPHHLSDSLLDSLMNIAMKYRDRVDASLMLPQVNWREPRNDRRIQMSMPTKSALSEPRLEAKARKA